MQGIGFLESVLLGDVVFNDYDLYTHRSINCLQSSDTVVYGLGQCAHWFHEIAMKRFGIFPILGVDKNPDLSDWCGVDVISPEAFWERREEFLNCNLVLCLGDNNSASQIQASLLAAGMEQVYKLSEFYEIHFPLCASGYQSATTFSSVFNEIRDVYKLFSDDRSKEIYLRALQTIISGIPSQIPNADDRLQYFPVDLTFDCDYAFFICCGSYDGENIRKMHQNIGSVGKIMCFEPDQKIFPKLEQCAQLYRQKFSADITCHNTAISDTRGKKPFTSSGGLGSRISETGESQVNTTSLDYALLGMRPTFISMDIEGEELKALEGGRRTLKTSRPGLGISVYHQPSHLWEVPNFLNGLNAGYRFYLRNYTGFIAETVLYASV